MGALPAVCLCTTHTQSSGQVIGLTVWSCHMHGGNQTGSSVKTVSVPYHSVFSPLTKNTHCHLLCSPSRASTLIDPSQSCLYRLSHLCSPSTSYAVSVLPLGCFFPQAFNSKKVLNRNVGKIYKTHLHSSESNI